MTKFDHSSGIPPSNPPRISSRTSRHSPWPNCRICEPGTSTWTMASGYAIQSYPEVTKVWITKALRQCEDTWQVLFPLALPDALRSPSSPSPILSIAHFNSTLISVPYFYCDSERGPLSTINHNPPSHNPGRLPAFNLRLLGLNCDGLYYH